MAELEPLSSISEEGHPLSELAQTIREPVSEDDPCGEDVKYDDAFQQLKGQINRIGSATGEVDYDKIVELGHSILADKSKDLMTAGYLAFGLARTKGSEGLAEGLVILHALIEVFWEGLHPQKPIRRRNALQFVSDRLKDTMEMWEAPDAEEREALEIAQEALSAIQAFTMAELEDKAPALSGLASLLRNRIQRLPNEPEPEPEEAEAEKDESSEEGPAPTKSTPRPSAPAEIGSASDATSAVIKAASFLREKDPTSLVPYRLLRSVRWGILTGAPPNEAGVTKVQPPLEQRRTYLAGLLEKQDFQTLLKEGEDSFQQAPFHFWLDLQRLLVAAAKALGKPYEPLAEMLTLEVAMLIQRLPALPTLRFSDQTPFADGMTQEWIETEVTAVFSDGGASGGASAASSVEDGLGEAYSEARKLLSNGDLPAALEAVRNGRSSDGSLRTQFRRRLYEATLCVRAGQHGVGRAILEGLHQEIERHNLDSWEPALALEAWSQLHACYSALLPKAPAAEKSALHERAQAMLQHIARVDPAQALSLQG